MPAEQSTENSESSTYDNVKDAVAELDRRAQARRDERREERKAREADKASDTDEAADGEEEEPRAERALKEPKAAKQDDEADDEGEKRKGDDKKPKARAKDDGDDESEESDDDVTTDEDEDNDPEEKPRKAKGKASLDDDGETVEIEHEGRTHRVPAALKDSFLRQADYTTKTQTLAQERQYVHQSYAQVQASAQQVEQVQQSLLAFAQAMLGQEPPIELARADPGEYAAQRALHDQRRQALEQIVAHGSTLREQQQAQARQQEEQQFAVNQQAMLKHAPELADPNNRQQFLRVATGALGRFGFSPEDVAGIRDVRTVLMVRRLLQLEVAEHQRAKTAGDVKTKLANVPPKGIKPGASEPQTKDRSKSDAKRRFMSSGRSMKDVAAYLKATS